MVEDIGVDHIINTMIMEKMVMEMATVMGPITGMEMVMAMVAMVMVATATVVVAMVEGNNAKTN